MNARKSKFTECAAKAELQNLLDGTSTSLFKLKQHKDRHLPNLDYLF